MATKKTKKRLVILAVIIAVGFFFRKMIVAQFEAMKARFAKK